jgi:hypothetical protein
MTRQERSAVSKEARTKMNGKLWEPDWNDLFSLDPMGAGCDCLKCHRHFKSTTAFHQHAAGCAPELLHDSPRPCNQPALQQTLGDFLDGKKDGNK